MVYQRKHDYEYREGWHPSVDANTVGSVMEEIEEQNGAVTSELFLEASRPACSPTHAVFEWNDGVAAEKYRLYQATQTIRAVRVMIQSHPEKEAKPRRAFVNIATEDVKRGQYINVLDAMSNEETRRIVLRRALRELRAFHEKYAELSELAAVIKAIEEIKLEEMM